MARSAIAEVLSRQGRYGGKPLAAPHGHEDRTCRLCGGAPAINDLVAGQIDFDCAVLVTVASQVQAGTVKALAGQERSDVIRNVPTTKDAGLPQFHSITCIALFGPKNQPTDIQAKLNDALDKALDDVGARKRLNELGARIPDKAERTPAALRELVQNEVAHWSLVLRPNGAAAN